VPSGEYIKTVLRTTPTPAEIYTSAVAIVGMLHSRQRRTIGCFLATAGLLVTINVVVFDDDDDDDVTSDSNITKPSAAGAGADVGMFCGR